MKTIKKDILFIKAASVIFFSGLSFILFDFYYLKNGVFSVNYLSLSAIAVFFAGVGLRIYCKHLLGNMYSYGLQIKEHHRLVKSGIYKIIRHPIYLAMIIYSLALPLIFSSYWGFVIMAIMVPFVFFRIKIEEDMLLENFGEKYREYMKHTKKIIPFIL